MVFTGLGLNSPAPEFQFYSYNSLKTSPTMHTCVNPWLIHVNVWQKPLQYCKVISLQLIKINEKKNF